MPALPTTRLSVLLPLILPMAKHCPEPYALLQARLACIDFCEATRCWRHVQSVTMTDNHTAIVAPTHSTIFEFEEVTWNGLPLDPVDYTEAEPDELAAIAGSGNPRWISQISPGEVGVFPFKPGTLRLSLFLKPRHGQLFGTDADDPLHDAYNVIPEFLFIQHATALADGALARILMTRDEPFFDPQKAAVHDAAFRSALVRKSSSHVRGQQRAPVRTKARWI